MPLKLCLLLLLSPSLVFAQKPAAPKWILGTELGYTSMYSFVDHFSVGTVAGLASEPAIRHDRGGEGVLALHLGKPMTTFVRADAYMSLNLVGVGAGTGDAFAPGSGTDTYTTVHYDGAESEGFVSTGMRFIAENQRSHSVIRPRAVVTAMWQWTKGPTAGLSGGISAGNQETRFTVDAGQQFSWLHFERVLQTYQSRTNVLLDEQHLNGTKSLSGFSLRLGIDHYVF